MLIVGIPNIKALVIVFMTLYYLTLYDFALLSVRVINKKVVVVFPIRNYRCVQTWMQTRPCMHAPTHYSNPEENSILKITV